MIKVSNISKTFGGLKALDEISFHVEKGQIVGFLGANGAGKTTTMDIICGCLGSDTGSVSVSGIDVLAEPVLAKKKIGYLPDEPPIHHDMLVKEFIKYVAKVRSVPKNILDERVSEVIEKLSLNSMEDRLIGNLSKGYKQRVGLAQALVHKPEVLVLDEPTEGLDPKQIVQIRELILSLKGEHTILFSSHILTEVESLCDKLIIVDQGRVIEQGSYGSILSKFNQKHQYSLEVRQGASKLEGELRSLEGLTLVRPNSSEDPTIEFSVEDPELIDSVASSVLKGGYGMVQLARKKASLEDVFFKLTN
ncbi:MAG: ABC transporter ATP-binding protein [Pseudobacteriovorax sp.]|nr:ABC transporter ATP-binding protein [Pseudobacteriovorax sp.]